MIGPASTFYDPEVISHQQIDSHAQYQQWISAYGGQQQVQTQQRQMGSMYQQEQTYHHEPPAQLQNHYNFVQDQYTPPTSVSHYTESTTGTAIQSNVGGRATESSNMMASYHQQPHQSDDMYTGYYPNTSANTSNVNTGTANTPDPMTSHTLSYNTTPDPLYQQEHLQHQQQPQLHHQSSQSQLPSQLHSQSQSHHHSYSSAQTTTPYTSELLTVSSHSNTYSAHSSSLSPASNSWTDEVYPSTSNTRASPTAAAPQPTVVPAPQNRNITTTNATTKTNVIPPPTKYSRPAPQPHQPQAQPRGAQQAPSTSTNPPKTSAKRKRVKKTHESVSQQRLYTFPTGESDSESDEDESPSYSGGGMTMGGGISVGMAGFGVVSGAGRGGRL